MKNAIHDSTTFTAYGWQFAAAALLLLVHAPLQALEFECNAPNDERFIHVDMPGDQHLCEVTVDYPSGEQKVLWYADHDTLFCSAKAYELRDRYENKWNFTCTTWPDRDGIDQLSARQRFVLDAQLKTLMVRLEKNSGSTADTDADDDAAESTADDTADAASDEALLAEADDTPTGDTPTDEKATDDPQRVWWVKAVTSESMADEAGTLALQFFIGTEQQGVTRDITQLIVDNGKTWRVTARVNQLSRYIDAPPGYRVDSAIVTGISDSGLLDVSTTLHESDASRSGQSPRPACQGQQYLLARGIRAPVARSEHRMVCGDT